MRGILVVDDHPAIRRSLRKLLDRHYLEVCGEAQDGEEAVEKVKELRPEVVLLDIQMPRMNGIEAAQKIRRILPSTKIIFLSSHSQSLFKESRLCSDGFVSKAMADTQLIPTLSQLLEAKGDSVAVSLPRSSYQEGDHVCALFVSAEEQLAAAVEYIRAGLGRGERCLCTCRDHGLNEFRAALEQVGIAVEADEARGALVLLTKHDGYLKDGSFDPDRMIALLQTALKDALDAGFEGLCATGDMSWILDEAPGSDKLLEYEARVNRFFELNHALGLCQYNLGTTPPAVLDHCLATHPFVRVESPGLLSNPFYELPEQALSRTAQPHDVTRKIRKLYSTGASNSSRLEGS